MSLSVSNSTGFWAELSQKFSDELTPKNLAPNSFSLAPTLAGLCFKDTFDQHCEANHISPWISKPVSVLTGIASAALALIAIPEALLRTVIAIAFSVLNILTGFESPMPGDNNTQKVIAPLAVPLLMAAVSLGLDID